MLRDVVSVQALPEHRLRVKFDDGTEGVVDVSAMVKFVGVFEPLTDQTFFDRVSVHPELRTVCWPNNADLDSDVLYAKVAGVPVPEYVPERRRA
jgi:hypothetical protein